jgi:transcriptional regulator with XRE-family HTH domain
MEFSQRLRQLREEKGMERQDLANYLNMSYSTIAKYESGVRFPDKETLQKIADFFNVSVDYLLGRTDVRNTFIPDDYTQKYKVTKKDLLQYEDFIKNAGAFFMNDEVAEEDKEKLFKDISELFWKAKEINKEKYGKKKKERKAK